MLRHSKSFDFKGDLLKASQVCLAMEQTMSDSFRHVKTADTPWIRSMNESHSKPLKSALNKHKIETASFSTKKNEFFKKTRCQTSLMTERKCRVVSQLKTTSAQDYRTNDNHGLSVSRLQQYAEDLLADHIRKSFQEMKNSTDNSNKIENKLPDVALNALDTIWELHKSVLSESPFLQQLLNEQLKL